MLKVLQSELEQTTRLLEKLRKKYPSKLTEDKLTCRTIRNKPRYYLNGKYLKKKYAHKYCNLAEMEYYDQLAPVLSEKEELLKKLIGFYEPNAVDESFRHIHPGKQAIINPLVETPEMRKERFMQIQYEPYVFPDGSIESGQSQHVTFNGIQVRSKSEVIIANTLEKYGIPYHYEMPLIMKVFGYDREYRPDFTILNVRTGKIFYWEHFGMMEDPEYSVKAFHKIKTYQMNGHSLRDDLLITMESLDVPLRNDDIVRIINECLL